MSTVLPRSKLLRMEPMIFATFTTPQDKRVRIRLDQIEAVLAIGLVMHVGTADQEACDVYMTNKGFYRVMGTFDEVWNTIAEAVKEVRRHYDSEPFPPRYVDEEGRGQQS